MIFANFLDPLDFDSKKEYPFFFVLVFVVAGDRGLDRFVITI
jgi:hypothetical protein